MLLIREFPHILSLTLTGWWEIKAPRLGAALAYYTVLSLAPLLLIAAPLITLVVHDPKQVRQGIVTQFEGLVGREGAAAVDAVLQYRPDKPPNKLTTYIGVAVLVFGATGVFAQLQDALNTIWGVTPVPGFGKHALWSFVKQRFLSFAMLMGICFLLLVSLTLTAGLAMLRQRVEGRWEPVPLAWAVVGNVATVALVMVVFAMMFKVLPDAKVPWRDVWLGALLTAILFTLGKYAIGLYLGRADVGEAYGGARSIVVLLVWVYFSSQIVFLGAEFTYAYHKVRGDRVVAADHAIPVTPEARAEQGIPQAEEVKATVEYMHLDDQTKPKE
ncbi:MAG: YihY/virulence factor BrkB family protein [Phycisphaerae bacterium]